MNNQDKITTYSCKYIRTSESYIFSVDDGTLYSFASSEWSDFISCSFDKSFIDRIIANVLWKVLHF